MLESGVGQWASSTALKKAKCTIDVYSIDEFIPFQLLDIHLPNKEGAKPISAGRRVESTASDAAIGASDICEVPLPLVESSTST
jgi:hypothetical protein